MFNNEDLIYVNCFYYGFYIKKNELSKYNIKYEELVESTKNILDNNKKTNIKTNIKISESPLQNIRKKLYIINSSTILNSSKILEQFNSCNFTIIYNLLELKTIIKKYKKLFKKYKNIF